MDLTQIHALYKREISFVKTPSLSKSRVIRQNLLMASLVKDLCSYYEFLGIKEVMGFEVNKSDIYVTKISDQMDLEKSTYNADLFTIFIGPFSLSHGIFSSDSDVHVLAECSSSSLYFNLSNFKVLHNTTTPVRRIAG